MTGYATTWVEVPARTEAVLHVGSGGAHKVWVGTTLVGEGQAYRRPNALQEAYALTLEPGWNRILIKVGCEGGAWGFYARMSTADARRSSACMRADRRPSMRPRCPSRRLVMASKK